MSIVVCSVQVEVTEKQLVSFLPYINNILDADGIEPLTLQQVKDNIPLLDYICTEAVMDGVAMYDPSEFWNNDGWCDVKDYI